MPIKDHGKSSYQQDHEEQHLHSSRRSPEGIAKQSKTRMSTSGLHKGSSTTRDHGVALPPSESPPTSKVTTSAPPQLGGYGSSEDSFQLSSFAGTPFKQTYRQRCSRTSNLERSREESARPECVQEDLGQNRRPAVPASDLNLQSHIDDLSSLFLMIEDEIEIEIETEMRRDLDFIPVTDSVMTECLELEPEMLKEMGFIPMKNSPFTELLKSLIPCPGVAFTLKGYHGPKKLEARGHGIRSLFFEGQESRTRIPQIVNRRVTRNLKYRRQAQLPCSQKKDPGSANVNRSRTSPEGEDDVLDVPTIYHRLIVEWKMRAGKTKDWRISPIRDLLRKDNLRGREIYERRHVLSRALSRLGRNMEIPRDMLQSYRHAARSDSRILLNSRHSTKRLPNYDWDKKPRYLDSKRKAKRERAIDMKDIISEGIASHRVAGHSDSEVVDTTIDTDEYSTSCQPTDSIPRSQSVIFAEFNTRAAGALSIPYESRIGAVVGGHFVLRGLISTKLCYDVHAVTDVCTDMVYTAKAYRIRGTKGNERKYRLISLKRNALKTSCIGSVDQGGRKWLFFSGGIERFVETGSPNDVSAWYGEEKYQYHFPALSPQCTAAYTPSRAAYVREVASQSDDRITKRKEMVRDRQRNKRKQKRAAEAAARKITNDEPALPDQTSTSVNTSRTASRSHVDPELRTFSIAGLSDGAEFERFLDSLDEDILERLYYKIDERFWEHLVKDPADTFERSCLNVSAGYRTLNRTSARVHEILNDLDNRMLQNVVEFQDIAETNRFSNIDELLGFVQNVRTTLRDRDILIKKTEDLAEKKWYHMDTVLDECQSNIWIHLFKDSQNNMRLRRTLALRMPTLFWSERWRT